MTAIAFPVRSLLSNGEFLDLLLNLDMSTVQTWFVSRIVKFANSPDSNLGIGTLSILRGLIDNFLISKHQDWGGVIFPYFWMLKFGLQSLSMYEYVYHANGDCVVERPENISILLESMGDSDFYPIGWDETQSKPMCNTTGFIIRSKWIQPMMQHIQDHLIPFEVYEKYSAKLGSGEVRFAQAVIDLGLKLKKPERSPFNLQLSTPGGTWYETIGFRHIHGEYKDGLSKTNIGGIPWQYIDQRYL